MLRRRNVLFLFGLFVLLGIAMVACSSSATTATSPAQGPAATSTAAPVPTCPAAPAAPACPTAEPQVAAPHQEEWAKSGHADAASMAFTDWNDTEDKSVPVTCAKCHSGTGFMDFVGADGSEAGKVDKPAPIGTVITCEACHNDAASALSTVTFPSGVTLSGVGPEARCMTCHQGRASKKSVDDQIAKFKAEDPDKVVEPLKEGEKTTNFGFINIHYFAAAATLYGSEVHGGYEYEGQTYDVKFQHTEGYDTCVACHNPHTLQVKVDKCAACHEGVKTAEDLKNIRMVSSTGDYDGDGDVKEGMASEIAGLRDTLYAALQSYAKDVAGTPIVYDVATYPYFMQDKDGDGKGDQNDKGANVAYSTWTPRMLKAAYNFQVATKDPGAFAHGNKYIVQLLHDSIADLNEKLGTKVDMTKMAREDAGHFAGDSEAFRHWDAEGAVAAGCSKCHSATGLPQFLKEGANISNPLSNGFLCSTCHDEAKWPENYAIKDVTFPSGKVVSFGENAKSNLCLECHQGRESNVSIQKALAGQDADTVSDKIRFRNVHYLAAGATLFGSEVQGMVQYEGKEYAGRFVHTTGFDTCSSCHDVHALQPKVEACKGCHQTDDPAKIRMNSKDDYDGDGDTTEGLKGEVDTYMEKLYAAIQVYAKDKAGVAILYNAASYPYFFPDADGDGQPDKDDKGAFKSYVTWTPRLLKAAYNYQYAVKDPGAAIHNAKYVMQALYDSLEDLGGAAAVQGMKRP